MARRCKTDDFSLLIKQAREKITSLNITTDIIVGFPGETDEEWQTSLNYIERIGFSHIHIFTYSQRQGTKAASLTEQVSNNVKKSRSKTLHSLANTMRSTYMKSFVGSERPVLWETQDEQGRWIGYTDNFIRVALNESKTESLENLITKIELTNFDDNSNLIEAQAVNS